LEASGADYSSGPDKQAHVITDGRLLTGQNPASAAELAERLVEAVSELKVS
jgi:putative intracellular protease/amidase